MATFKSVEDIANELLDTKEGKTVSVIVGDSAPTSGYVSAIKGHEFKIHRILTPLDWEEQILHWVKANRDIAGLPNHFLGVWVSGDYVYFDVSRVFPEREQAIRFGRYNFQIAIWDLNKGEEIVL